MALSYTSLSSGGVTSGFAIDTGDGTKTDVTLSKEYPAGGYQIASANGNQNLFIFLGASDGTPAGGTSSKSIVASKAFNKLTIIGATANDLITFTYKETATLSDVGTSSSYSGAVVTSFTPNQVSSVNDTVTINGAALGTNVTVKFTGKNNTPLNAKNIVRVSETQIIATRPDTMPGDQDPYKITVQNPGIEPAVSTNVVSQPLYAGTAPTWSTSATLPAFTKNSSYTQQLLASDPDGTAITYSFISGSLPAGLSYSANSSTISGIPTAAAASTFTIRATELSGRYTDRTFTLPNAYPVFTTSATLPTYTKNVAYSTSIIATDDSGTAPSLSVVGATPAGLAFNSLTGTLSGTPTQSVPLTITIRATDANGSNTDQTFNIPNSGPTWVTGSSITAIRNAEAYSYNLSATDDGTVTYSIISGSLPSGISLASNGLISGTTSSITGTNSTTTLTFRATDDAGNFADKAITIPLYVNLYAFTSHTFTNAGQTGYTGPTLSQVRTAYSSTSWAANYLNMNTQGIQEWTVPTDATYRILAVGAGGGGTGGGTSASMRGDFTLSGGSVIKILVGQAGSQGYGGSGGGGTFVATSANGKLIIAGGGGGGGSSGGGNSSGNQTASFSSSASESGCGTSYDGNGGCGGNGVGGGGFSSNGGNGGNSKSFINGGQGSTDNPGDCVGNAHGGFGGGGAGGNGGGGGGGAYGGCAGSNSGGESGQGGGSYNGGSNQSNGSGVAYGNHGYVTITKL
jgi:hypothetical protein